MSHFKNVNVVYYTVKDWEGAKKFYGDVLGWPVFWSNDEVGWCEYAPDAEGKGTHFAINRYGGEGDAEPSKNGGTCTLTVDDVHQTQAWLESKGVRIDHILDIPGVVTIGTFYDPEGNRIQFVTSTPPPA